MRNILVILLACAVANCSNGGPSGRQAPLKTGQYQVTMTSEMHAYNTERLSPGQLKFLEEMKKDAPILSDTKAVCVQDESFAKSLSSFATMGRLDCDFAKIKADGSKQSVTCKLSKAGDKAVPIETSVSRKGDEVSLTMIDIYDSSGDERGNIASKISIKAVPNGACR